MRLKMFSPYDHFPNHNYVEGEPYIPCYNDRYVMQKKIEPNAVALLIEPRSLIPEMYTYIENHSDKFKLIFTHDSILLSMLPNTRPIIYGGIWDTNDIPKTKDISFCSANKDYCFIHKQRRELAFQLENKIDCMGTYNGGHKVSTYDIYAPYKFSVVIENYVDDLWFTEKICNAFSNKCVPIYYGARKITDYFDSHGIVIVKNFYDIPAIVDRIKENVDEEYDKRKKAIEKNYIAVRKFRLFEEWFFNQWGEELEKLL